MGPWLSIIPIMMINRRANSFHENIFVVFNLLLIDSSALWIMDHFLSMIHMSSSVATHRSKICLHKNIFWASTIFCGYNTFSSFHLPLVQRKYSWHRWCYIPFLSDFTSQMPSIGYSPLFQWVPHFYCFLDFVVLLLICFKVKSYLRFLSLSFCSFLLR